MKLRFNGKKFAAQMALAAILLLLGGAGGYFLGIGRARDVPTPTPVQNASQDSSEKNLYDGSSLTLAEMYESLQSASGSDFDHRLIVYLIAMKQNESGMLKVAEKKSQQELMKKYVPIQLEQNDTVTKMLFDWQKQWGFSHH